jgi:hypothetical protein
VDWVFTAPDRDSGKSAPSGGYMPDIDSIDNPVQHADVPASVMKNLFYPQPKRARLLISWLLAGAALTACGGGNDSPSPDTAAAAPQAKMALAAQTDTGTMTTKALTWQAAGPGTSSITPSTDASDTLAFAYDLRGSSVWSQQTWTYSAIATQTMAFDFDWNYSGFHAWYRPFAKATAFAEGPSGTTYIDLNENADGGGFNRSGTGALSVTQGYRFGFIAKGSNYDSNTTLNGNLKITAKTAILPHSPPLIYGSTYYIKNNYSGAPNTYLDVRGGGCDSNWLCVSTASSKSRDQGSGSWILLSAQGKPNGSAVTAGDLVHLANKYPYGSSGDFVTGSFGGFLDTRNHDCQNNVSCVSTSASSNRDSKSGTWKIEGSGNIIYSQQSLRLRNIYNGTYLDTRGGGCMGNILCVSTSTSSDRDSGSSSWRFEIATAFGPEGSVPALPSLADQAQGGNVSYGTCIFHGGPPAVDARGEYWVQYTCGDNPGVEPMRYRDSNPKWVNIVSRNNAVQQAVEMANLYGWDTCQINVATFPYEESRDTFEVLYIGCRAPAAGLNTGPHYPPEGTTP